MKKALYIFAILGTVFISSCSKSNETDYASKWLGVYNNPSSGLTNNNNLGVTLNNIIVTKVDASTLKVQIKGLQTNYISTYTILKSVSLNGATKATIDEMGYLVDATGQYHIKGNMVLNGTHITLTATATNMASSKESDIKTLNFAGELNQ